MSVSVKLNDSQKAWLGKTAEKYHEALDPATLDYLAGRGLDLDAVHGYRLGLVADPDPLHEAYRGRLSIPYITPSGTVFLRFRCLEDHRCEDMDFHGKYESLAGEGTRLYNVRALHEADTVIGITEGELDGIVSSEAGLWAAGVPGATNWKPHYYRLFDDFERVLILGDGDQAGRQFASKLAHTIPNGEAKVLPAGHDVTSFVVENGSAAFLDFALA